MTKYWHAFHDILLGVWDFPDESDFFYERLALIESLKRGLGTNGVRIEYWSAETEEAIQHRLKLFRPFTEEEEKEAEASPLNISAWAIDNHARCCGCGWKVTISPGGEPNGIFAGWTREEVGGGWLS